MGNPQVFAQAAAFLALPTISTVEDWGCGHGQLAAYLAPHQTYVGVDASAASAAQVLADLRTYRSQADGIFCRGVMEHCPDWSLVVDNLVASFVQRAVLVVWLPFADCPSVDLSSWAPTVRLTREDLEPHLAGCRWQERAVPNHKAAYDETLFLLERQICA